MNATTVGGNRAESTMKGQYQLLTKAEEGRLQSGGAASGAGWGGQCPSDSFFTSRSIDDAPERKRHAHPPSQGFWSTCIYFSFARAARANVRFPNAGIYAVFVYSITR